MSNDPAGEASNARRSGVKPPVRPLSPHLQIWRWHVTMLGSILSRVTGIALYAGAFAVVAWLVALALGGSWYECFVAYAASPLGLLVWLGFSASGFYHLAAGVRHTIWDLGAGLTPPKANLLTHLSIWFAVIATVAFWAWLFLSGKVVL